MGETATATARPVETSKVTGRRMLRFESIDQVMADVERLAEAERAGRLRHLGNWTLGQTLGHLACWVEYSYTGAPLKVPAVLKWILRLGKRRFLYGPMRPGARIPGVEGGTLATASTPLEEGLGRMRRAMERLKAEAPTQPQVIFGPLAHDEWIAMHLRHAELHLGFLVPE
jgi:Protein of unknown function (DUF1569)